MKTVLYFLAAATASATVIPEPGFIMYGAISNTIGAPAGLFWQVSSGSSNVSVAPTTISVNSQYFYVAAVPFETRSIGGNSIGPATPNTFALNSAAATYTRSAIANGTNATIIYASSGSPNTFTFGPADRGRIERVDLSVSPPLTFAQWLPEYGLPADSDPNSDPTHKGMTLMQQFIAGLDPIDPTSLFKFVGILPLQQGVEVQWSTVADKTYTLQQGASLDGPFTAVQTNIIATPRTNSFLIPMPTNNATLFFRVLVE